MLSLNLPASSDCRLWAEGAWLPVASSASTGIHLTLREVVRLAVARRNDRKFLAGIVFFSHTK